MLAKQVKKFLIKTVASFKENYPPSRQLSIDEGIMNLMDDSFFLQ